MKKTLLFTMVLMAIFSGCKKDKKATATFSLSKSNYYLTEPVLLSNSATNATSYTWNFGDGQSSTEQNPQHAYSKGGTFQIKLTVNGGSTITKAVKIYPGTASYEVHNNTSVALPLASFAADANDELIDFQDHGTVQIGGKSDTVFTNNAQIYIAGQLGGKTFIVTTPYPMIKLMHTPIAITDQSQIYIDNSVKGNDIQNLFHKKSNQRIFKSIQ